MEESVQKAVRHEWDQAVRAQLAKWPQCPPGVVASAKQPGTWLRARPADTTAAGAHPFLKLPGSNRLRTLPDGLWLHFSPSPLDPYVDIICIEACSSVPNLLDKRSRFAPSTSSLLVFCPVPWLLAPSQPAARVPRWRLIRMLHREPAAPLVLPVRDARVVFGLKRRHYENFVQCQVAQAHEFFCPMEALAAEDGHEDPEMRALIARASAAANFMRVP